MSEIQLYASVIPIKIILNTNIPNSHIIEFTSSLLYNPILKNTSDLEKYPAFTNLYKYDEQSIVNKPYDKIVNFFFNKKTFIKKIANYGTLSNIENANENNLHNIMVMLKALFHINDKIMEEPIGNSYENKYGSIQSDKNLFYNPTSIVNNVFNKDKIKNMLNISNSDYYTYITINGEKYTFQRIVWLNDLKAHPFYKKLVNEYIIFNRWLNSTKGRKFKNILDNNSFETIENTYNEESKYGKFYGYYNRQKNENIENNSEKKDETNKNKLMISLYAQPEFKKFYQIMKIYQDKESKNDLLQQSVEFALSGISPKPAKSVKYNIIDILNNLLNNNENIQDNNVNEYYYTDILHDTKSDNYEINILADFIKGEMNDEKYKNVNCDYESDKLGRFLEENVLLDKQKFENKNKNTIFSIDENKVIDVKYNDSENEDEIKDALQIEKNNKIGGKRKYTNKKKWKKRNTKKNI
jgi:hypothetical protein